MQKFPFGQPRGVDRNAERRGVPRVLAYHSYPREQHENLSNYTATSYNLPTTLQMTIDSNRFNRWKILRFDRRVAPDFRRYNESLILADDIIAITAMLPYPIRVSAHIA